MYYSFFMIRWHEFIDMYHYIIVNRTDSNVYANATVKVVSSLFTVNGYVCEYLILL